MMSLISKWICRRYYNNFKCLAGIRVINAANIDLKNHWQAKQAKPKKFGYLYVNHDNYTNISSFSVFLYDLKNWSCSSMVSKGLKTNLSKYGRNGELAFMNRPTGTGRCFTTYSKASFVNSKPTVYPLAGNLCQSPRSIWSTINIKIGIVEWPNAILDKTRISTLPIKLGTSQKDSFGGTEILQEHQEIPKSIGTSETSEPDYLYFHPSCTPDTRASVISSFKVQKEFVSEDEENTLMKEVEPHLQRCKYEFNHWDDVSS